jgi:hypothetical protein
LPKKLPQKVAFFAQKRTYVCNFAKELMEFSVFFLLQKAGAERRMHKAACLGKTNEKVKGAADENFDFNRPLGRWRSGDAHSPARPSTCRRRA